MHGWEVGCSPPPDAVVQKEVFASLCSPTALLSFPDHPPPQHLLVSPWRCSEPLNIIPMKPLNSKELFRELCSNPSEILFFLRAVKNKINAIAPPSAAAVGAEEGSGKGKIGSLLL